jgi:hypothetical protein
MMDSAIGWLIEWTAFLGVPLAIAWFIAITFAWFVHRSRTDNARFGRTLGWVVVGLVIAEIVLAVGEAAWSRHVQSVSTAEAEGFKQDFDQHLTPGTAMSVVDEYLKAKPVTVVKSFRYTDGQEYLGEYWIEVVGRHNIWWFCGRVSFGVVAYFSRGKRLERAVTNVWSMDCL